MGTKLQHSVFTELIGDVESSLTLLDTPTSLAKYDEWLKANPTLVRIAHSITNGTVDPKTVADTLLRTRWNEQLNKFYWESSARYSEKLLDFIVRLISKIEDPEKRKKTLAKLRKLKHSALKGKNSTVRRAEVFWPTLEKYVSARYREKADAIAKDICNTADDSPAVKWKNGEKWNAKNKRGDPRKPDSVIPKIRQILSAERKRRSDTYGKG